MGTEHCGWDSFVGVGDVNSVERSQCWVLNKSEFLVRCNIKLKYKKIYFLPHRILLSKTCSDRKKFSDQSITCDRLAVCYRACM